MEQPASVIAASARNPKVFILIDCAPPSLFAIARRVREHAMDVAHRIAGEFHLPSLRRECELAQLDLGPLY